MTWILLPGFHLLSARSPQPAGPMRRSRRWDRDRWPGGGRGPWDFDGEHAPLWYGLRFVQSV